MSIAGVQPGVLSLEPRLPFCGPVDVRYHDDVSMGRYTYIHMLYICGIYMCMDLHAYVCACMHIHTCEYVPKYMFTLHLYAYNIYASIYLSGRSTFR
jgi:hypothetical protein